MYSVTDVRSAVRYALDRMTNGDSGFYAPLVERFPLIMDENEIPPAVMRNLKAHQAPACTDGTNVYVDTQEMLNTITMAQELRKKKGNTSYGTLEEEVTNILAHEYTHILCQHTRQGQEFNRNHRKDKNNICLKAFQMACEVEANRGYMVSKMADVYKIAVTEDSFPKTRNDSYLPQIYSTIKEEYENELDQMKDDKKETFADEQGEGEGEGVPDEQEEQSNSEQGSDGESENNEAKGEGSNAENENSECEGNDGTQGTSHEENSSEDGGRDSSQESAKLSEEQKSAIQRMLETDMALAEERLTAEDLLPHDEDEDTDNEIMNVFGLGGEDEGFLELSPTGKLKYLHGKWKANNLKKELAKLKGVIEGTVARERVKTYSRQSRKQGEDGLMMKGHKRASRSLPKILLAMDSSGSMCSATMKQIASAIADIFDTCGRPTEGCYICKHTHRVSEVKPLKQWKTVAESFYASGGNDFSAVMEKALELGVDVVLNVGDGQDYCIRDYDTTKKAVAKGLKWYDCNVTHGGYRRWSSLIKDEKMVSEDRGRVRMERHWIDLTGEHPVDELKGVK